MWITALCILYIYFLISLVYSTQKEILLIFKSCTSVFIAVELPSHDWVRGAAYTHNVAVSAMCQPTLSIMHIQLYIGHLYISRYIDTSPCKLQAAIVYLPPIAFAVYRCLGTKYMNTYRVPQCMSRRPNGDPHPLSRKWVCTAPPPPPEPKGGTHSPAGKGRGGPNSDYWRKRVAPCLLYSCLGLGDKMTTFLDKSNGGIKLKEVKVGGFVKMS
jgi:hypothetical protein